MAAVEAAGDHGGALVDRAMTILTSDLDGVGHLRVGVAVAVHVLRSMTIHALQTFFEVNVLQV